MSTYKVVNSDELDRNLSLIADKIREKNGSEEKLIFPQGYIDEIDRTISGNSDDNLIQLLSDKLISINSTEKINIRGYSFYGCKSLENVSLPNVNTVGAHVFHSCTNLYTVNLQSARTIDSSTFHSCSSLSSIDIGSLSNLSYQLFYGCSSLEYIKLPKAQTISQETFKNCISLSKIDSFLLNTIGMAAFSGCTSLYALILRNTGICSLGNVSAFTNTPISNGDGYIYVPSELVGQYKQETNWTVYADKIRAIEDYPEICGVTI